MPLRVERVWSTCRNRIRVARVVGIGDIKVKSETLAQSLAAPPPFWWGAMCPPVCWGFLAETAFTRAAISRRWLTPSPASLADEACWWIEEQWLPCCGPTWIFFSTLDASSRGRRSRSSLSPSVSETRLIAPALSKKATNQLQGPKPPGSRLTTSGSHLGPRFPSVKRHPSVWVATTKTYRSPSCSGAQRKGLDRPSHDRHQTKTIETTPQPR